jgi:hypothetical protein
MLNSLTFFVLSKFYMLIFSILIIQNQYIIFPRYSKFDMRFIIGHLEPYICSSFLVQNFFTFKNIKK